jgi:hypothetical protein
MNQRELECKAPQGRLAMEKEEKENKWGEGNVTEAS